MGPITYNLYGPTDGPRLRNFYGTSTYTSHKPHQDILKSSAFCYKHEAECPLRANDIMGDAAAGGVCVDDGGLGPGLRLRGDVAGTSCTDESSMGLRRRWAGKTALSFAVWLTEIKHFYSFAVQAGLTGRFSLGKVWGLVLGPNFRGFWRFRD